MAAERKSIYWGESVARIADPLVVLLGGEGAAVNAIADRYAEMIRRERPELTFDEWEAIVDANNGVWAAAYSRETPRLEPITDEIAAKHQIDGAAVNAILAGLSFGGRLAVLAVIERCWAHDGPPLESLREAIK